jgi:benzoyl-CoA reductase/2-hydroxyglutaryl-CoA dehydratase subunit BcrC/BadD/HgdB
MKQFDAPKKKKSMETDGGMDDDEDEVAGALDDLEEELEDYEKEAEDNWENNMRAGMTSEDVEKLDDCVKPVRSVLSKVNSNRTTWVM